MEYPQILLPQKAYKLKIELSTADAQTLFIIRRSLVSEEETTNGLGSVRSHSFIEPEKEHLFLSLSLNLLGLFQKEHLSYILDKEHGRRYWLSKDEMTQINEIVFSVVDEPCPIYLNVSKVKDQPFNYSQKKHDGKIQSFQGTCTIIHKPLHANYWHFEIEVLDESGNRIAPNDKEWKKVAATNFFESYLKLHLSTKDVDGNVEDRIYTEESI